MTDFLKIAKSVAVHFAHICAYGVETVKDSPPTDKDIDSRNHQALVWNVNGTSHVKIW